MLNHKPSISIRHLRFVGQDRSKGTERLEFGVPWIMRDVWGPINSKFCSMNNLLKYGKNRNRVVGVVCS